MKYCEKCNKHCSPNTRHLCRSCYRLFARATNKCSDCSNFIVIGAKKCRKCYDFTRSHQDKPWHKKEWLEKQYLTKKLSFETIAKSVGINPSSIRKWCFKFGINPRPAPFRGSALRELNPSWKGGRLIHRGYAFIHHPEPHSYKRGYYVPEHTLVMEQKLGRKLMKPEVVHHLDGNPSNNSPENLMLFPNNGEHRIFEEKVNSFGKSILWGNLSPELKDKLLELFSQYLSRNS